MGLLTSDKGGILNKAAIRNAVEIGTIKMNPWLPQNLIDDGLLCYAAPEIAYFSEIDYIDLHIDPALTMEKKLTQITIPPEGIMLRPGIQYLISTLENIASSRYMISVEVQGVVQLLGATGTTLCPSPAPSPVVVPVQVMYPTKVYRDTLFFVVRFIPIVTR